MKRIVIALAAVSLLGGCGARSAARARRTTTPTVGERIPVLGARERRSRSIRRWPASPSPFPGAAPMRNGPSPAATPPSRWAMSRLGTALGQAWRRASARAAATRAGSPPRRWSAAARSSPSTPRPWSARSAPRMAAPSGRRQVARRQRAASGALFGGGVSYDNGRVYATNGAGDAAALDAETGAPDLAGPARRPAARRSDRRQRQCLCRSARTISCSRSTRPTAALRWTGAGALEIAGVFGSRVAGRRAGHGRRRLLVGRAQRLSLREWPGRLAGRARADQHLDHRHLAVRHRRRSGDRRRPGLRGRPGRPHGRARADHRPARLGDQRRRHLDALGRRATGSSSSPTRRSCSPSRAPPARCAG